MPKVYLIFAVDVVRVIALGELRPPKHAEPPNTSPWCERDPSVGRAQTDAPRVQRVGHADRPTVRYAAPHGRVGQTGTTRGGSRRAYAPLRAVFCGPRLPNSAAGHVRRHVAARRTSCTQKQAGLLGKIRGSGSKALWSSLPQVSQMVPRPGSNPGGTDPRRR